MPSVTSLVAYLFFTVTIASSHKCIHEEYIELAHSRGLQAVQVPQVYSAKRFEMQGEAPKYTQPMRIKINFDNLLNDSRTCYTAESIVPPPIDGLTKNASSHTCREADILTKEKKDALMDIMSKSTKFFEEILLVLPRTGPISVDSTRTSVCDQIVIPKSYDTKYGPGVGNADYVLFVTSRPASSDTTLAYAKFCQVEEIVNRPIVGIVNFAPFSLDTSEEGAVKQIGVILHEITHSLGFSKATFEAYGFTRWNGAGWERVNSSKIVKTYNHPEIGHTVKRIITPYAAAAAQKHYGCPGLDGPELEDGGGEGTAGSHWEQRTFMNEYMTGTSVEFPVVSDITLALFKDTGWYDISPSAYKKLAPLLWGKNMGCSFVNGSCKNWPLTTEKEGYRCDSNTPRGQCRFDMLGWAHCNKGEASPLADGCEFFVSTPKTSCDFDTKLLPTTIYAGESHTNHSHCFHSTLAKLPGMLPSFFKVPQAEIMQCYATKCAGPDKLKLYIDGVWYDCPYRGGYIQPIDYGGQISCRPHAADLVCTNVEDDFTWPTVTRVSPHKAKPGDNITIHGSHFNVSNSILRVTVHADCPYVEVLSNNEILVTLPSNAEFSSVMQMGLYSRRFSVIVTDDEGRTGYMKDAILIETQLDGSDIGNYFSKLGIPPAVTAIIAAVILVLTCVGCVYWCRKSWRLMEQEHVRKGKRPVKIVGDNGAEYLAIPTQ